MSIFVNIMEGRLNLTPYLHIIFMLIFVNIKKEIEFDALQGAFVAQENFRLD